tara:strand:+ start:46 stop:663 length:618 start_codon:yes stop_codon:yes gene_type:complete
VKEILNEWRQFLNESSLSRLYRHMMAHDTAIITAHRGDPSDDSNCVDKSQVTDDSSNKIRNRDLKATLMSLGYGVTSVDGSYIESFNTPAAYEVAEDSFFVVNLEDDPDFTKLIIVLGEDFCQDAVLVVPKGGEGAYLHGTNNSEFPGYGQRVEAGDLSFGREKEFMTKVGGRPMAFTEELETYKKLSRLERMAAKAIAKKILKD